MATKSDALVKLVLVFVISLLSFAVGTFIGKKYSDQQHKLATFEPTGKETHERAVASEHGKEHGSERAGQMTDDEIAKLAEEFVTDDTAAPEKGHGEAHGESHAESHPESHGDEHGEASPTAAKNEHGHGEAPTKLSKPETAPEKRAGHSEAEPSAHGSAPLKAAQNLATGKPAIAPEPKHVTPEDRLPAALPANVAQYPAGKFTVQVAAMSSESDAKKRAEELRAKGYSAFYLPAVVGGKTWYRVSVGQFPTEAEAKVYRTEFMQKAKIESAIIQKIVN